MENKLATRLGKTAEKKKSNIARMFDKEISPQMFWGLLGIAVVVFTGAFLSFQAGVFLLLFIILAWWTWEHPESGFLFIILAMPILPMLKITQTIGTLTILKDIIILTLLTRVFLLPLLQKKLPYKRNILFAPIVSLIGWTAWGTLQADSLLLGILRARDIVLYILLFFIALYLPHSRKIMKERTIWITLTVAVVLSLGVFQWFMAADSAVLRYDPGRQIWIPRISSIMAHPSILGQYLVVAAGIFTVLTVFLRKKSLKIISALTVMVLAVFIFLTYSRAVWFALAGSLGGISSTLFYSKWVNGYITRLNRKKLWNYSVIGAASLVLLLVIVLKLTPAGIFIRSAFDPTYGSNEERIHFMVNLIAPLTNTQAIIGNGLGNVLAQQNRTVNIGAYDIATASVQAVQQAKNRTLVDNQYLKTFIEMGLIGLLIYIWIFWVCLKGALSLVAKKKGMAQIIGLTAIGFFTAFILQGFFIDIWEIWPTNGIFWIMAGLVSYYSNCNENNPA